MLGISFWLGALQVLEACTCGSLFQLLCRRFWVPGLGEQRVCRALGSTVALLPFPVGSMLIGAAERNCGGCCHRKRSFVSLKESQSWSTLQVSCGETSSQANGAIRALDSAGSWGWALAMVL